VSVRAVRLRVVLDLTVHDAELLACLLRLVGASSRLWSVRTTEEASCKGDFVATVRRAVGKLEKGLRACQGG
jgi:hypothetical protein